MRTKRTLAVFIMLAALCSGKAAGQWTEIGDFRWPDWPERDFFSPVIAIVLIDSNIFACTLSRGIFLSSDTGKTWKQSDDGMFTDIYRQMNALISVDGKLYAGTQQKGLFRSVDTGRSWTPITNGLPNPWILALTHKDGMLFASTPDGVFRSSDGGMDWEEANNGISYKRIEYLATSATMVYAGAYRTIYGSSDLGASWQRVDWGFGNRFLRALGAFGGMLFAGTDSGVYRSSDEGRSWTTVNNGLPSMRIRCFGASDTYIFAGCPSTSYSETLYLSTDLGTTWKSINDNIDPFPDNFISSIFTDEHFVYVGAGDYKLLRRPLKGLISSFDNPGDEPGSASFLLRSYPNPAAGAATLSITLPRRAPVSLRLYDVRGIEVLSWPEQLLEAGTHERKLTLPGGMRGVYICVLSADRVLKSRALIML